MNLEANTISFQKRELKPITQDLQNNLNIKILTKYYKNQATLLDAVCKCGNEFQRTLKGIKKSQICNSCAIEIKNEKIKKRVKEKYISKTKEQLSSYDLKIVSVNDKDVVLECSNNHTFEIKKRQLARAIKNEEIRCPHCYNNSMLQEIKDLAEEHNVTLLSTEYTKSIDHYSFSCKCGKTFSRSFHNMKHQSSFFCSECMNQISKNESKIASIFEENGIKVLSNDKNLISPREIDILLPELKFGIEYDGIKWHSEKNSQRNKTLHVEKTNEMEIKGYQLFHIFENEWLNPTKKAIWESLINRKIGLSQKIDIKDCEILKISKNEANDFFEENDLEGKRKSILNLSLKSDNKILVVMSFVKYPKKNNDEWEIVGLAQKNNIEVVGGESLLLDAFEKEYSPKYLVGYSNRRWDDGEIYKKMGFKKDIDTQPNYFYFKENNTKKIFESKLFKKNKIFEKYNNGILDFFDETLDEWENMKNNDYDRIFDCGKRRYLKKSF